MSNPRHPLALRIPADQLAQIDKRAKHAGMSRTEYMVRSSLGELDDPSTVDDRLVDLEKRMDLAERRLDLTA